MLKKIRKLLIRQKLIAIGVIFFANFWAGFSLPGDLWVILFSGLWISIAFFYGFKEKLFFGLSLFFLIFSLFFLLAGKVFISERMAIWEFIFLFIGAVWGLYLNKK